MRTEAAPVEQVAERALPEIEHAVGATRQAILDHFLDSDSPDQSMAQIKAALSNVLPGTVEACVRREWQQGRLQRVSPGVYRLAPAKPPPPLPEDEAMWFSALERWAVDPASWNVEEFGPTPDQVDNRIPSAVKMRFNDRIRKRHERRKETEAAAAKRAAADVELRDKLIAATRGQHRPRCRHR